MCGDRAYRKFQDLPLNSAVNLKLLLETKSKINKNRIK